MRRITIDDLYSYNWLVDPAIAPDGAQIAYTHTYIDRESKEYRSHLWLVPTDGSVAPRRLSSGPNRDTTPRWSPDGTKIAFVSRRSGENQLWLLPLHGGEAQQLTTMRYGAGGPQWSPDGTKIAFVAQMSLEDDPAIMFQPQSAAEKEAEAKKKRSQGLDVESLDYRSDPSGFFDGRYQHVWVLDIASGKISRITDGPWHHQDYSWSPCSSKLVIAAHREADAELSPWNSDLWIFSVEGGEPQQITRTSGPCQSPVWSPDGKHIAYLGHRNELSDGTLTRIWLISPAGGEPRCLTSAFDQGFNEGITSDMTRIGGSSRPLAWFPCSGKLISSSGHHGSIHLYAIGLDGKIEQLTQRDCVVYGHSLSADGALCALAWSDLQTPNEISALNVASKVETALTESNPWLNDVLLSETEVFWNRDEEGWDLQCWLMKPIGWREGATYPMILTVHGGPHGMYGFAHSHTFQTMAALGYYVLYTNPRGGNGYGQAFRHGVIGHYGEGDYRDVMRAVDTALARHADIDPTRLGVTGASYGGFMTNWIVGHTDRFKAAVTACSISNWVSFFGTSDIGHHFCDSQHGANPLTDFEAMVRFSPITYVKNVVTPLLIIHHEQDYRCPIEQGEQLFVSLKKLQREVKMVRFNNANHSLAGSGIPVLRRDRLEHLLGWFTDHIETRAEDYASIDN